MDWNKEALKLIEKECWLEAQDALKKAVKEEPSCKSYNNLGVFYIDNGIQNKLDKFVDNSKQGYSYLEMASLYDIEYKNLIARAEYNYHYGSVEKACSLYKKASEIDCNFRVLNNLACSLYKVCDYIKASIYFDKALKIAENNVDDIKISYCYSLLKCKSDYRHILESISKEKWTALDRFVLYYFSENYERAFEIANDVIESWEFELPVLAMIYDCFQRFDITKLKLFDVEIIKMLGNEEKRKEYIRKYTYLPVMLWQCKYIGCNKH